MKKVISFILVMCLITTCFTITSFASITGFAIVSNAVGKQGDEVTVTVSIGEKPKIAAYGVILEYDKTALKLVDLENCSRDSLTSLVVETGKVAGISADGNIKGALFNATFKILAKSGKYEVGIVFDEAVTVDLTPVTMSVTSGVIEVLCEHTYDNTCDTICNDCGLERMITHSYTNKLDTKCNVCSYVREIEPDYIITIGETMSLQYEEKQNSILVISDPTIAKVTEVNSTYAAMNGTFVKVTNATISLLKTGCVLLQVVNDGGEVLVESVLLVTEGKKKSYGDTDGNGEIDAMDSLNILQASVGKIQFTDEQLIAGDVDGDGEIFAIDALLILQYSVGKITKFPVEE